MTPPSGQPDHIFWVFWYIWITVVDMNYPVATYCMPSAHLPSAPPRYKVRLRLEFICNLLLCIIMGFKQSVGVAKELFCSGTHWLEYLSIRNWKPEDKTSFHCFWQEGRGRGLRDTWQPSHFGPFQRTLSWWSWLWWWWWRWWWQCWTFHLWAKIPSWSSRRCARSPGRPGLPLGHYEHNNDDNMVTIMTITITTTTTTMQAILIKVKTENYKHDETECFTQLQ